MGRKVSLTFEILNNVNVGLTSKMAEGLMSFIKVLFVILLSEPSLYFSTGVWIVFLANRSFEKSG